jgi:hypothetical protein
VTGEASPAPYGASFFDELCRLTKSTCGLSYAESSRVREMNRDQVLRVLSKRYDLDWLLKLDSRSPVEFARAIVEKGVPRTPLSASELAIVLSPLVDLDLG